MSGNGMKPPSKMRKKGLGEIGLLDIDPDFENTTVTLPSGKKLVVYGYSAEDILNFLKRYPALQALFMGQGMTIEKALDVAPGSVKALIAIACGNADDEEAEEIAGQLPASVQLDILRSAAKLTFGTGGFGPFVQQLIDAGLSFVQAGRDQPSTSVRSSPTSPSRPDGPQKPSGP